MTGDAREDRPGSVEPAPVTGDGREEGADRATPTESRYPVRPSPSDEFGWEGWVAVGVVLVCFLLVPPAIIYLPEAQGVVRSLGLTLRDAYLALPMVPAILLGATGVWAALRHRRA
jgi:hypothetical protein